MTEVRGDHQISSLNRMTRFIDGLNQVVVHNLNQRPFELLITTLVGTIILVNAWTLIPRPHVEIPSENCSYPEYWSFLFVVFAPYLFGTCCLVGSFWYGILGDNWWTGQGIRPLLELSPLMFLPLILGCLISVFPDEIRLPLIQSKIWWPAILLTGVTVTFAIFIWNRRSASLRKNTLTRDVANEHASERIRPKIQKTAKETPESGSILQAFQPEMESHLIQRALVSVVCLSLCAGCYFLGQIFSHFYFNHAPYNLVVEIVLIESFKVTLKMVTFINITISDVFLESEVFSTTAYYFGELAFYIFYRNLFTSKMNSAWTVVGLCALNAGMYGLLPVTYMSRWGYRNLQILRILKIRTTVDENMYPAYVLIVARKMVANALATVVSMVSFFVWSLGTRYISNERDFMTYGRTHQDDEAFFTVLNKQAGALASEVFAICLGFWWAKRYHNCNPIREFTDWMIKNPSFYYCFVTSTCHVLSDLVIALISNNFM